jgi:tetratricopeptide (TPR) repeat protein
MRRRQTAMIRVALLFLILLHNFPDAALADETQAGRDFLAAGQAYETGQWNTAISLYEGVMDRAGFSASLCYNLANSYAQNGQTGKAVLHYERALLLTPGDADSRHNLQRLRQEKGLEQGDIPLMQQAAGLLGLNQWTLLAASLVAALALFHLATMRLPVSTRLSRVLTSGGLLLLCLCSVAMLIQYRNWQRAVLSFADTPLLISPFAGAKDTAVLQEGSLIHVLKTHDQYALIRDEQGQKKGWVPIASFEYIARTITDN